MRTRKEMKRSAKHVLKRHYWLMTALCLIACVFGGEFAASSVLVKGQTGGGLPAAVTGITSVGGTQIRESFTDVLADLLAGDTQAGEEEAEVYTEEQIEESNENQGRILGRSRGVLSMLVNGVTSGSFLVSLVVGVTSIIGSESLTMELLIAGSLLLAFLVWFFTMNVYPVVLRRMALEGRCYEKLLANRALFLARVKRWFRASQTMLLTRILQFLWMYTVVGGIVKHYSYFMVPYIAAENPDIPPRKAIRLSCRMMNGHKMECFRFELSLLGWTALNTLTLGLSGIFFSHPYRVAVFAEYYEELRRQAKEAQIPGAELLADECLFVRPKRPELEAAYADTLSELQKPTVEMVNLRGISKLLANLFGVLLTSHKEEKAYEEAQARLLAVRAEKDELEGAAYPVRLCPLHTSAKRAWVSSVNYMRNYSFWSLVMMFFILSFVGWLWEVSLHLISDGTFVNRGVLHGPWLPIYGTGGVLILLALNKFRKTPIVEFLLAVVLSGNVEYWTAYYLEMTHDGKKWWDYSGYFLNLDGRICAEGLLVFGLGGIAIVYVAAPVLDNLIRKIPFRALVISCLLLVAAFSVDQVYSRQHPNEGAGITDYTARIILQTEGRPL